MRCARCSHGCCNQKTSGTQPDPSQAEAVAAQIAPNAPEHRRFAITSLVRVRPADLAQRRPTGALDPSPSKVPRSVCAPTSSQFPRTGLPACNHHGVSSTENASRARLKCRERPSVISGDGQSGSRPTQRQQCRPCGRGESVQPSWFTRCPGSEAILFVRAVAGIGRSPGPAKLPHRQTIRSPIHEFSRL